MLVGRRDRTHGTRELAAVGSLPHDLEHDGVVAFDGFLDRALDVEKGLPPALAELNDRVRSLGLALRRELLIHVVGSQARAKCLPVAFVERLDAMLRLLNSVRA